MNRFEAKARQWSRKSRKSAGRLRRTEREGLEIRGLRARLGARRKSSAQDRSNTTMTYTKVARHTDRL